MNIGPNQEKWLQTLESGDYNQGTGKLCRGDRYCCLGVAAEIFECDKVTKRGISSFDNKIASAPDKVINTLKLYTRYGDPEEYRDHHNATNSSLARLNDDGVSFKQLASIIRKDPARYFSGSN